MEIPVGGESFISRDQSIFFIADIENLRPFLTDLAEFVQGYKIENVQEWRQRQKTEINPTLFAACHGFTAL